MNKIFCTAIVAAFCSFASAQVTNKLLKVNLPVVLKLAGANNLTIKQYDMLYQRSLDEVSKADEWYLPTLFVGPEVHFLKGAVMRSNGDILNNVTQKELWLGGGVSAEWDFGDGIYNVMAKKQQSVAIKAETQAERNNIILNAISDYYDLLTAQFRYMQLKDLLAQADTISRQIKIQVNAGLRYQSEYLLAQSNYSHIQVEIAGAEDEMQQKSNMLLSILNMDTNVTLTCIDTGMVPLQLIKNITDTSMMAYAQYAASRPEYQGLQAELDATEDDKKTTTVGLLMPKVYLGSMPDGVLGDYGAPYNGTYRLDGGLLWSIPLGRLIYAGDLKMYNDEIQIDKNNLEQFNNEVHLEIDNARSRIIFAMQQMNISTGALQKAKDALNQSVERERLGTVRPFEVFQSEQFYVQAELDYLNSVADYNKAQYQMYVASGNNL